MQTLMAALPHGSQIQFRWQVFELEAYAMYCSTKKWGKYI
jgi:hypothetical protein